jgi:long-chain acyl-CoA synthetase
MEIRNMERQRQEQPFRAASDNKTGLFDYFTLQAAKFPRSFFLEDAVNGCAYTYGQASGMVEGLATMLRLRGVGNQDRVLIIAENECILPILILAIAKNGGIFSIVSPQIRVAAAREIISTIDAVLIVIDKAESHLAPLFNDKQTLDLDVIRKSPSEDGPITLGMEVNASDPAALIFTSGSMGDRKGVVLSHGNIRFTTQAIQERLQYGAQDRILLVVPLSFDYGLYQIFLAFESGACLVVAQGRHSGPNLLGTMKKGKITVFPGVPILIGAFLALLRRAGGAFEELRILTNTGEHLSENIIQELQALLPRLRIYPMYGITECKRISILTPDQRAENPGSVGRCLDGTKVFVTDENRLELRRSGTGELAVQGANVTLGYWGDKEGTDKSFSGGPSESERMFFTGDLCTIDSKGFIYFRGRLDSLIKHKGHRISPIEIERHALDIGGFSHAIVVQSPSDNRLHLFLKTDQHNALISPHTIYQLMMQRLETYKVPESIHFVPEFPTNPNGKIDRKALIETLTPVKNQPLH